MILLAENSWEVKNTPKKGRGVFTKKPLSPGIVVGDYLGRVIRTANEETSDKDGLYLMYYSDQAAIYPTDVNAPGIHQLNHSCAPNCWVYTFKGHTLVFTLRYTFPGEELTIAYLLSPEPLCVPCPHVCNCGSSNCTRTMHLTKEKFEKWRKFSDEMAKKTKKLRVTYGKELPKLTTYPESISDHPIYALFGTIEQPALKKNGTKLPSTKELRKLLRETGKTIEFPRLNTQVLGVADNKILTVVT